MLPVVLDVSEGEWTRDELLNAVDRLRIDPPLQIVAQRRLTFRGQAWKSQNLQNGLIVSHANRNPMAF